jgi:CheY-like chemotaxis protein
MVRQLLTFAKGAEGKRVLLQPRHVLTEMEKLLTNTFPKTISLTVCYPGDLRSIVGEATQLYQLLLNLCVNARDAMPDGGTLTLEASNLYVDPALANQIPGAQAGNYVVFRVCDTGCGIPIELQQRVFEPFFSTKGPENATGLGLATVAGIVRGHGGFIRLHSQPGKGATFEVYIPTSAHADTSDVTEQTAPELNGSGQLVLVVDDDPAVREVTKVVLESHNLRVVLAGDGAEGMLRAVENRHQLRAVICDLHMPHLDGIAFIRALRHLSPKLPVIVVTGHREERHDRELSVLGVAKLLEKPHTSAQLLSALKPLLM